jgi:hypothetical protein
MLDWINGLTGIEDRKALRKALGRLGQGAEIIKLGPLYINMTYATGVQFGEGWAEVYTTGLTTRSTIDPAEIAALRAWCERGMGQ